MTLWNDFTTEEKNAVSAAILSACTTAAGVTLSGAQTTAAGNMIDAAIASYAAADVRCLWEPEDVVGIVSAGRPYLPDIAAILRNSTDATFVPSYGRKTTSGTSTKTGTEQVSLKPAAAATLPERITVAVPDIRAASIGEAEGVEVDAAEKFRFDASAEKSLAMLFNRWIRRASFSLDL